MKIKKFLILFTCVGVIFSWGCAHKYVQIDIDNATVGKNLTIEDSVYITLPEDGQYGDFVYKGSGQATAYVIRSAFLKHLNRVEISEDNETLDQGLDKANEQEFTHLVLPIILHWEDRATEWSGISDKVEVKIMVVDVETGNTIDSVVIKGKSKWATWGGDHPQDLLPVPITNYVSSLF